MTVFYSNRELQSLEDARKLREVEDQIQRERFGDRQSAKAKSENSPNP